MTDDWDAHGSGPSSALGEIPDLEDGSMTVDCDAAYNAIVRDVGTLNHVERAIEMFAETLNHAHSSASEGDTKDAIARVIDRLDLEDLFKDTCWQTRFDKIEKMNRYERQGYTPRRRLLPQEEDIL